MDLEGKADRTRKDVSFLEWTGHAERRQGCVLPWRYQVESVVNLAPKCGWDSKQYPLRGAAGRQKCLCSFRFTPGSIPCPQVKERFLVKIFGRIIRLKEVPLRTKGVFPEIAGGPEGAANNLLGSKLWENRRRLSRAPTLPVLTPGICIFPGETEGWRPGGRKEISGSAVHSLSHHSGDCQSLFLKH